MSFLPADRSPSREDFTDSTGFTLDESGEQVLAFGRLRLRAAEVDQPPRRGWAPVDWGQTSEFLTFPTPRTPGSEWGKDGTPGDPDSGPEFTFSGHYQLVTSEIHEIELTPGPLPDKPLREDFKTRAEWKRAVKRWKKVKKWVKKGKAVLPLQANEVVRTVETLEWVPHTTGQEALSLNSETSQSYVYQGTSEYFPLNADNSVGYTLELRAHVQSGQQQLLIDDGTYRETFFLGPDGITHDGQLKLAVAWDESPRRVRLGVRGQALWLLEEGGQAYYGTSDVDGASTEARLVLGNTSATPGEMLVDYLYQVHDGVHMDVPGDVAVEYPSGPHTSLTPAYWPQRPVSAFDKVVAISRGPWVGTASVQAQYNNTTVGDWTDLGTPTTLTSSPQEISLSGITPDGDGSDQVRFRVVQQRADANTPPAEVDTLIAYASFLSSPITTEHGTGGEGGGFTFNICPTEGGPTFDGDEDVYIGGVLVDSSQVDLSGGCLVVTSPPGSGRQTVVVDDGGSLYTSDVSLMYVTSYDRGIDREAELARSHPTKSVFRIKDTVPEGEIGLAHLSGAGLEVERQAGMIDLSFFESGNVVTDPGEPFYVEPDTSVGGVFSYSGLETDELAVAVAAQSRNGTTHPAPLSHGYLLGGGRFYVDGVAGQTLSALEVRGRLRVHHEGGTPVALDEYPWDVHVSSTDVDGNALPDGVYAVLLLCGHRGIPGKTVFVSFAARDRSRGFETVPSRTEVVNAVPLLGGSARSAYGAESTFDADTNTYDLTLTTPVEA